MTSNTGRVLVALISFALAPGFSHGALIATPAIELGGTAPDGEFGYTTATADFNGDGFQDLLIGALFEEHGEDEEGRVYVYLGRAGGLESIPAWTAESNQIDVYLGWTTATGDFNGDGFGDVAAAAPYTPNGALVNAGRVYVWYGGAPGAGNPSGLGPNGTPVNADWQLGGTTDFEYLSLSMAAGDINNDGRDELVLGSVWSASATAIQVGRVQVFRGATSGLGSTVYWSAQGAKKFDSFGVVVTGDVNCDGFGDIAIGAPGIDATAQGSQNILNGQVFVYLGSAAGLGANGTPGNADWTATPGQTGASFGSPVSPDADLNGDGCHELIVGASGYDNGQTDEGVIFLWYGAHSAVGNPTGLGTNGTPANADWSFEANVAAAELGYPVSSAGDVNGDGFGDLLVVDSRTTVASAPLTGTVWLYLGGPGGIGAAGTPANADVTINGTQGGERFGYSMVPMNLDGDRFGDLALGVIQHDAAALADSGAVRIYRGACGSIDLDGDGVSAAGAAGCLPGELTDCNDADALAFAAPVEVAGVTWSDPVNFSWTSATGSSGSGTVHDVLRGMTGQYPVGSGSGESCLASGTSASGGADPSSPAAGSGYFYLIRARNGCGTGTYGTASSGAVRVSTACP